MFAEQWPGAIIPSLPIGNVQIRPYVMSDGAFPLSKYVMMTCSSAEIAANSDLAEWERRASTTRKPVECEFGVLKKRFSTLSSGIMQEHEDNVVYFITAGIILHILCVLSGDDGSDFLIIEDEEVEVDITESNEGHRVRKALLEWARNV